MLTADVVAQLPAALEEAKAWLEPAVNRDFKMNVAPALALVAPASMSREDCEEWLAAAKNALRGMPGDLLAIGCQAASRKADHPSKIVKVIFETVQSLWDGRRQTYSRVARLINLANSQPPEAETYISPEEAAAIIAETGLRSPIAASVVRHSGPPRSPTTAEQAEIAREVGINPTARSSAPSAPIAGLSIAEIFAQRDARRARELRGEAA